MMLTTWIVWADNDDVDPFSCQAEAAFVLPGGFLALGEDVEPGVFRPGAIFAPGAWARAYQVPTPSRKEAIGK